EVVACFPVYRTYVVPDRKAITDVDRGHIESAIAGARAASPDGDAPLFEFLCELLTLAVTGDLEAEFVLRFQQLTGPAMAKGVEDTVFYTYNRLIALNEVGGDPSHFGLA